MINDKLCRICNESKDPRLFPKQSRICYECKAEQQRTRVAIKARNQFNKLMLMSFPPLGIFSGSSKSLKQLKNGEN